MRQNINVLQVYEAHNDFHTILFYLLFKTALV